MITTFREAQALLMLFQACPDEATRRRAAALVPGLEELSGTLTFADSARRRRLTATNHDGLCEHRYIVCRNEDLNEHKRDFALSFDRAAGVIVRAEDA